MDILNLHDWQVIDVTEEQSHFFIRAKYIAPPPGCINCSSLSFFLQEYGIRQRIVKDTPIRGKKVTVMLSIQRYRCGACEKTFVPEVNRISGDMRLTKRLVEHIERESAKKPFLTVAQETGVNENTVREIFTRLIEKNAPAMTPTAPRILGIDEVYIGKIARCVLTDIENRRVIDILPKRDKLTVFRHLIQLQDKDKIEVVAMDMWRPFYDVVKRVIPQAEIVVDKYHIQRMGNQAVRIFLRKIKGSFSAAECRENLRDPYLLLNRNYALGRKKKKSLSEWCSQLPDLKTIYELKEEFFNIWKYSDRGRAELAFSVWKGKIPPHLEYAFAELLTAFGNWHREIFNYFDYRVTNAFTESANNLVKSLQRLSRGASFEIIRAKILYKSFLEKSDTSVNLRTGVLPCRSRSFPYTPKTQRTGRLKRVRQANDELFALTEPPASWKERFAHFASRDG